MFRSSFGESDKYCVRYDGTETKVDIVGNLSLSELSHLLDILSKAYQDRLEFNASTIEPLYYLSVEDVREMDRNGPDEKLEAEIAKDEAELAGKLVSVDGALSYQPYDEALAKVAVSLGMAKPHLAPSPLAIKMFVDQQLAQVRLNSFEEAKKIVRQLDKACAIMGDTCDAEAVYRAIDYEIMVTNQG